MKHSELLSIAVKKDMDIVERALELVLMYHFGQVDKAGDPYIYHCARVAFYASAYGKTQEEIMRLTVIGLLHDIVEDTEMTAEMLRTYFEDEVIVDTICLLTRTKGQTYFDYIDQISESILAIIVKLMDIQDHLRVKKGFTLPQSLLDRYKKAQKQLINSKVIQLEPAQHEKIIQLMDNVIE